MGIEERVRIPVILITLAAIIGLGFAIITCIKSGSIGMLLTAMKIFGFSAILLLTLCISLFRFANNDIIIDNTDTVESSTITKKINLFESKLSESTINKREKIYRLIEKLKEDNYYSTMFDEINKVIEDFVASSVVHNSVSEKSLIEYDSLLDKYSVYVDKQQKIYKQHKDTELQDMQPIIDKKYEKITGMFNLMIEEPLDYIPIETQSCIDITKNKVKEG